VTLRVVPTNFSRLASAVIFFQDLRNSALKGHGFSRAEKQQEELRL
jgi:hypothetical protein